MDYSTYLNNKLADFVAGPKPQAQRDETQETGSGDLPVTVRFAGYRVTVDASQYNRVVLTMENGSTEEFTGQYSNQTTFAHSSYRGQDRTSGNNPADEVFDQFNGPIREVTVESSDASATVSGSSRGVPTGVQINCSNVTLEGEDIFLAGFQLDFTDGSYKDYSEADFGRTLTIGSGGRRVDAAYLRVYDDQSDIAGWFEFSNPDQNCNPSEPTTVFECTEVQITPEENIGDDTIQERPVTLYFTDGTEQEISGLDAELPAAFAGEGENTGKIIEAIGVNRLAWGSYYYLVNPDVESCTDSQQNFAVQFDCYAVVVDGESYDRVELETVNGTETFEGDFSGENRFGFFGEYTLRNQDAPNRTYSNFSGPIVRAEVFDGDTSQVFEADSVENCWFNDAQIECSTITFDRYLDGDFRARFPNAYKRWDGPKDGTQVFGSPGRTMTSFSDENAAIYVIDDTERSCDPQSDTASTFDCTTFTIEPAEFVGSEPTFNSIRLQFTDGSTQQIGSDSDSEEFTAPETFAGSDEHEGKVIESVRVFSNNGDVFFEFSNPDADSCEGGGDSQPVDDGSSESDTDDSTPSTSGQLSDGEVVGTVTLNGTEYLVLQDLPDGPPDQYAFVNTDYELLEPARATDVAISYTWMNVYGRDSSDRLAHTNRQYEQFQNVEILGETANILAQISGAVALATISPTGSIISSAEALGDVIDWQINEISNPYQEQYTRMAACSGTILWTDQEVPEPSGSLLNVGDEVNEISQLMLETADAIDSVNEVASSASTVREILRESNSIRDDVSNVSGVDELRSASYTVLASMAIDAAVSTATNVAEVQAKSGALGAGNAAARRPLLNEIIGLEQRIEDGTLGPQGILRLQALRQTDYQLEAAAFTAMSKYQSELSSGILGAGYDVLLNTDGLASQFASTAEDWLNITHYTMAQTGMAFDMALERYENSKNYDEFGEQSQLTRP